MIWGNGRGFAQPRMPLCGATVGICSPMLQNLRTLILLLHSHTFLTIYVSATIVFVKRFSPVSEWKGTCRKYVRQYRQEVYASKEWSWNLAKAPKYSWCEQKARCCQSSANQTIEEATTTVSTQRINEDFSNRKYYCGVFEALYDDDNDNEYWIGCEECDVWFHGNCVGVHLIMNQRSIILLYHIQLSLYFILRIMYKCMFNKINGITLNFKSLWCWVEEI